MLLNPEYTFDSFIINSRNEIAIKAAYAIIFHADKYINPLFLYGKNGTGKTHLLQATASKLLEVRPYQEVYYASIETIVSHLVVSIQCDCVNNFRNFYQQLDFLLIDDVHFLKGKPSTAIELFLVLEELCSVNKQVIVSADSAPEKIFASENNLIDFFYEGQVIKMNSPLPSLSCHDFRWLQSKILNLKFGLMTSRNLD